MQLPYVKTTVVRTLQWQYLLHLPPIHTVNANVRIINLCLFVLLFLWQPKRVSVLICPES